MSLASSITKPFPCAVTKAFNIRKRITHRYDALEREFSEKIKCSPVLAPNTLLAQRYKIMQEPFNNPSSPDKSGEAFVYLAEDQLKGVEVALKVFHPQLIPNLQIMNKLQGLVHPNLVGLISFDKWQEQYFQVLEFCSGGTLEQHMPFNEESLSNHLADIVNGLHFCHQQGITHGDIKPANLFYRDNLQQEIVIGDYGTTLLLHRNENNSVKSNDTFTLDYAAPELLDGKNIDPKGDYYALGITLIHLLLGRSPFAAMSEKDILISHLRGRIPELQQLYGSKTISDGFYQLIQGLLYYESAERWGADKVNDWLRGHSTKQLSDSVYIKNYPYPNYKKATNPKQLAAVLDEFNAEQDLRAGKIRQWAAEHFDSGLAENIERLETQYPDYPSIALVKLRYILDPGQHLFVDNKALNNIAELVQLLGQKPELFYPLYQREEIATWIEAKNLAKERTAELLTEIESIRERLPYNKKAAMMALLYTLDPHQALQMGEISLNHPNEIKKHYIQNHKKVITEIQKVVFNHRLEEWIRAAKFDNWQTEVEFLKSCRTYYLGNQQVGAQCVLWHYIPELPFPFAGTKVSEPKQLASLIDESEQSRDAGTNMLAKGWIRAWLIGTGKIKENTEFDEIMANEDISTKAKLEIILKLFNPELQPPKLYTDYNQIDFGEFEGSKERTRILNISNHGRGELYGSIELKNYQRGIKINKIKLEGNHTMLNIGVSSLGLVAGNYQNAIVIKSNGGNKEVNISFKVLDEKDNRSWWEQVIDDL